MQEEASASHVQTKGTSKKKEEKNEAPKSAVDKESVK